jgi:tetratricopeptide (TPR) repeat protein
MLNIIPASSVELSSKLAMVIRTFGFYLKKLIVPLPLNFGIIHIDGYHIYTGIAGLILVAYFLLRRNRMTFMFLSAFCLVSPALLVPLLRATWTPAAERYLYMSSAFFAIGMVMLVERMVFRSVLKVPLFSFVAIVLLWEGYETYERNLVWQDNELLFRDTLTKSPDFIPAQNDLAGALQGKGRFEEAAALLNSMDKNVTINHYQIGEINKALVLARQGKDAAARAMLHELLNNPGNFKLKILQTLLQLDEERLPHTQKTERTELQLDMVAQLKKIYVENNDPIIMYRLGQIYSGLHSLDEAGRAYRIAADRAPGDAFYKAPSDKLARKFGH